MSFSVSGPNKEDPSYAIFGGINEDQIVGGIKGLKKIQTFAYSLYILCQHTYIYQEHAHLL